VAVAILDPEKYIKAVQQIAPDRVVCYAGLLHSECESTETRFTFKYKCDTCGHAITDEKIIKQEEEEWHQN
jgi:hypothetical protein